MDITINGITQSLEEWEEQSGVPGYTIKHRIDQGYDGTALLIPVRAWRDMDRLQDAIPRDQYERAIRRMIKNEIPQFRFDIIVELCRDIGHGGFKTSALRRHLSRGSFRLAVAVDKDGVPLKGGLLSFAGPQGTLNMEWMRRRADQCLRWQNPLEGQKKTPTA